MMKQNSDWSPPKKSTISDSPTRFLPSLPESRRKPEWQQINFKGRGNLNEEIVELANSRDGNSHSLLKKTSQPVSNKKQKKSSITNNLSYPKKDREAFRQALVGIIMQNEEAKGPPKVPSVTDKDYAPGRAGSPTVAEKDVLRYYYYIHHGIDTKNVAPMEDVWIDNVLSLVPEAIKCNLEERIEDLSDEIREDYLLSVKKAIVDFVLRDPREKDNDVIEEVLPHRIEMMQVPKPWKQSFLNAYASMEHDLHITNPTMLAVLGLWHRNYSKVLLINKEDIKERKDAVELSFFQNLLMRHIESAKETFLKKWFPEVQNIFYQGNKRKLLPSTQQTKRLASFFNSAAVLMSNQLQSLTLASLREFGSLLRPVGGSSGRFDHPGFIIRLVLDGITTKFEPDFHDFQVILLNVFDVMLKAVAAVPCVETKLYSEWSGHKKYLKPKILGEILSTLKEDVTRLVAEQSAGPMAHAKEYQRFDDLISHQAETDMENYLLEGHTFEEFAGEVSRYNKLIEEISYNCQKIVTAGMFEMHCDEIVRTLTKRAENVRSRLLTRMLQDHQVANKHLCDEYEAIAEKALTSPSNTEHLMELKSYIRQIQNDTMFDLENRLVNTKERLSFLVDFVTLSPADVRMNNSVFQWHQRMPEVFGEHQKIVDANRAQYENALKQRRERFIEDLDGYSKQVEEFQSFGEMAEIKRYLKKAQALQSRLDAAGEKIIAINEEEEAFGWDVTTYPVRQYVLTQLNPFLKLYESTVAFENQHHQWMKGSLADSPDPDFIETETGNLWRGFYKLEKQFKETPNAQKIALKMKTKVDSFKDHLPLVHLLFNPGLRDRHWESMSEIVGYPLQPDESSNLQRFVDMKLEPFLSKFEGISEAASKEYSLEKAMEKMSKEWADIKFVVIPYRETGTHILSSVDDIQNLLDDQIVKTQTMRGSPFIKPFEEEIKSWKKS